MYIRECPFEKKYVSWEDRYSQWLTQLKSKAAIHDIHLNKYYDKKIDVNVLITSRHTYSL